MKGAFMTAFSSITAGLLWVLLLHGTILKGASGGNPEKQSSREHDSVVPGEIILKLKPHVGRPSLARDAESPLFGIATIDSLNRKYHAISIKRVYEGKPKDAKALEQWNKLGLDRLFVVSLPKDANINQIIDEYAKDPNVEYVERNYIARPRPTSPSSQATGYCTETTAAHKRVTKP
jgi:hypothetical protein